MLVKEPCPFRWGGVAVIRDGGVMRLVLGPMTPPPPSDGGTSPFEWGGFEGAGLGAKDRPFHCTGSCGIRSVPDRKSTRLNSSHSSISYAVFCLKKKN